MVKSVTRLHLYTKGSENNYRLITLLNSSKNVFEKNNLDQLSIHLTSPLNYN